MIEKKIVIIDDSKVTRRHISLLLEKNGYKVIAHENVEVFLNLIDSYRDVSLVLLDINLPGMDGLTALEYINQLSAVNHIPIIILSGHCNKGMVQKALSLNVIDYVTKPYIASKLLERIAKVLDREETTNEV